LKNFEATFWSAFTEIIGFSSENVIFRFLKYLNIVAKFKKDESSRENISYKLIFLLTSSNQKLMKLISLSFAYLYFFQASLLVK